MSLETYSLPFGQACTQELHTSLTTKLRAHIYRRYMYMLDMNKANHLGLHAKDAYTLSNTGNKQQTQGSSMLSHKHPDQPASEPTAGKRQKVHSAQHATYAQHLLSGYVHAGTKHSNTETHIYYILTAQKCTKESRRNYGKCWKHQC